MKKTKLLEGFSVLMGMRLHNISCVWIAPDSLVFLFSKAHVYPTTKIIILLELHMHTCCLGLPCFFFLKTGPAQPTKQGRVCFPFGNSTREKCPNSLAFVAITYFHQRVICPICFPVSLFTSSGSLGCSKPYKNMHFLNICFLNMVLRIRG